MKKAVLDTSFILTCVRQRIDFFEELKTWGMKILIPEQVIFELKKITKSKKKAHFRKDAGLALKLLEMNKNDFEEINLEGKNVDKALMELGLKKDFVIGTLDKEIKKRVKKKIVVRKRKMLEIV